MKYLTKYKLYESVIPYDYKFDETDLSYEFSDGENNFDVEFTYITEDNLYELKWYLNKGGIYTYDIINGNVYRILETILGRILNDFISKVSDCTSILIQGMSKRQEDNEITQRTNVYYRYLKNNPILGWSLDRYKNEIYLDKNEY